VTGHVWRFGSIASTVNSSAQVVSVRRILSAVFDDCQSAEYRRKEDEIMTAEAGQQRDDLSVTDLVTRSRNGDQDAWDALVERYAPLVWSICRRYRLSSADTHDVGQSVWLYLLQHLDGIREPAALPGWLMTTTRRECGRVVRAAQRAQALGQSTGEWDIPDERPGPEHEFEVAESRAAILEAFLDLPTGDQQLITLLIQEPPVSYAEISLRLGIPVGSLGPKRRRCLERLRRHPALAALITGAAEGNPSAIARAAGL
jgi:RNA polymerase sigma factor (sigma-70 family)